MATEKTIDTPVTIIIQGEAIKQVDQFSLGKSNNSRWQPRKRHDRRLGHISQTFGKINRKWRSREICPVTTKTKTKIYEILVHIFYELGCWAVLAKAR